MMWLIAEWRRLYRQRSAQIGLLVFGGLLCLYAVLSGARAEDWRSKLRALGDADRAVVIEAHTMASHHRPASPEQAAGAAFHFAKSSAPHAMLAPSGGLALGSSALDVLPPAVRVTVESRHTSSRHDATLANPLLQRYGGFDLATAIALLTPLAMIALCAGIAQGAREAGTWRLTVAHGSGQGRWIAAAIVVRAAAVWMVGAVASSFAFVLDSGATLGAYTAWLVLLAVFVAWWAVACAMLNRLPGSEATAIFAGLGLWAVTTFGVPAMLGARLDQQIPIASRLATVVQIRNVQQHAEAQMPTLVEDWYRAHPAWTPTVPTSHKWPVTFLPRYIEQEARLRPIMAAFHETRAARYVQAERWAWLSPALSALHVADRLAGTDAPRYARFAAAVDAHEAAWRAFFVPRVMSYRGVSSEAYGRLPAFTWDGQSSEGAWRLIWPLLGFAALGSLVLAGWRGNRWKGWRMR